MGGGVLRIDLEHVLELDHGLFVLALGDVGLAVRHEFRDALRVVGTTEPGGQREHGDHEGRGDQGSNGLQESSGVHDSSFASGLGSARGRRDVDPEGK